MKDDNMMLAAVFFIYTPLFILSMVFAANAVVDLQLETAIGVEDTLTFEVSENWSDFGILSGLETDGDIIYPSANQDGTWTSFLQEVDRSRIVELSYTADVRDGAGNITVSAWSDDPSGTNPTPDATEVVAIESGQNSEVLGFEQYDYFEAEVYLDEQAGSSNKRPNVDEVALTFDIVDDRKAGINDATKTLMLYLLMAFGVATFVLGIYKSMKAVIES